MGQEIFPIMRGEARMEQEKSMRGGGEDPILRPRPAPLPSLSVDWFEENNVTTMKLSSASVSDGNDSTSDSK